MVVIRSTPNTMEEYFNEALSILPLGRDGVIQDNKSIRSPPSTGGPFTTPNPQDDTQTVIAWQAAELLHRIDTDILIHRVPRLAGACCEIEHVPIIKSYMNMLLLLQEKDTDKQWIARIPYQQEDPRFLIDQVEPLLRARQRFKFRVPHLYHYGLANDPKNELGVDYMLLDFMDGRQCPMWTESFPAQQQKKQVLQQIAEIYMEMFSKPAHYEDRLQLNNTNGVTRIADALNMHDVPPSMTATLYLHNLVDEAIRGKFKRLVADDALERTATLKTSMDHRYQDLLTLLMMRSLVSSLVVGKYNDSPFFLTHPDLHNRNIIIEGHPVKEPKQRVDWNFLENSSLEPPDQLRRTGIESTDNVSPGKLKVVGLIDWDAAHAVPLQFAAIYPKFLVTLPGAEFPDLPEDYKNPDLEQEKNLFLEILSGMEVSKTGHTTLTDLIRDRSWERDFFAVALKRGDVRAKWFELWKDAQATVYDKPPEMKYEFLVSDVDNIRSGLQTFLMKHDNIAAIEASNAWSMVARLVNDLERMEVYAAEISWIFVASRHQSSMIW